MNPRRYLSLFCFLAALAAAHGQPEASTAPVGPAAPEAAAETPSARGAVYGLVIDAESGAPMEGVSVVVVERTDLLTRTNAQGRYRLEGVPAGAYTVRFFRRGFVPTQTEQVEVTDGGAEQVNMQLRVDPLTAPVVPPTGAGGAAAGQGTGRTADDVFVLEAMTVQSEDYRGQDLEITAQRQTLTAAMDGISAESMSKLAIGDAGEALTRVTGVNVVNGQFAVVRGLNDRYSSVMLNGVPLPSPDPERQAIQLDLFPSETIGNIAVFKSFTPNLPGNTSGGAVDIASKAIPDERFLVVGGGIEVNDRSMDSVYPKTDDIGSDWRWANGKQDRIPFVGFKARPPNPSGEGRDDPSFDIAFAEHPNQVRNMLVRRTDGEAPVGFDFGFQYGDRLATWGEQKLGLILNASYEYDVGYREGFQEERWGLLVRDSSRRVIQGLETGELPFSTGRQMYVLSQEEVTLNGLLGLTYQLNDRHLFRVVGLYTRKGIDTARTETGWEMPSGDADYLLIPGTGLWGSVAAGLDATESGPTFDVFEWQNRINGGGGPNGSTVLPTTDGAPADPRGEVLAYQQRDLRTLQLGGEHRFDLIDESTGTWTISHAEVQQDEPDVVIIDRLLVSPEGFTELPRSGGFGGAPPNRFFRSWRSVDETSDYGRFDLTVPVYEYGPGWIRIQTGAAFEDADRVVHQMQRRYSTVNTLFPIEELADNLAGGRLAGSGSDQEREITAGYLQAVVPLPGHFELLAGARVERTDMYAAGVGSYLGLGPFYGIVGSIRIPWASPWRVGVGNNLASFMRLTNEEVDRARETNVMEGSIGQTDLLPSATLKYEPIPDLTMRLSGYSSLGRPSFREMGAYWSTDPVTREVYLGNPKIQVADVRNFDFRVDWYHGAERRNLLSFSLFYKEIDRPIELYDLQGEVVAFYFWNNNENTALVKGAEFEARQQLGDFWAPLRDLSVGGNFTYIDAKVREWEGFILTRAGFSSSSVEDQLYPTVDDVPKRRRLFDQPEYIVNLDLTWEPAETGFRATVAYYLVDDVLVAPTAVSRQELQGATFYKYTAGYHRVDLILAQQLGERWSVRFAVKNLTDSRRGRVYDPEQTNNRTWNEQYHIGRDYSLSVGYRF